MQEIGKEWVVVDKDENEVTYYFGIDGSNPFYIKKEGGEWEKADMVFYKGGFYLASHDSPVFRTDDIYWDNC